MKNPGNGGVLRLVGNTPLIVLERIYRGPGEILGKAEFANPTGSLKDRMALYLIRAAEVSGELKSGSVIVEATSGNTGISFAMVAPLLGYKFKAVMPENMTPERRSLMAAYGAEIVLTPGDEWIEGSRRRAEELAAADPRVWIPRQFDNPENVRCHEETTGPEIIAQAGKVDSFVAGVGTGGTLMGVARALRKKLPRVRIVAVEPAESPVLSGGMPGKHSIQGLGAGFVPSIVDMELVDEVIPVAGAEAVRTARRLAREEGLFVGVSSGATVAASMRVAERLGKGARVVAILADRGDRYLSMGIY